MRIQIQESSTDELGGFSLTLSFDNDVTFQTELTNPHGPKTEENLEWYFEEYINEPYIAETRVKREKQRIKDYGLQLFEELFADRKAYARYRRGLNESGFENLTFEITSQEASIAFQSVLWEALRDPDFPEAPLAAKGVHFYRKSLKPAPFPSKVNEHPEINLLIVTARPSEDNDVDYRTIQRPLIDIIRRTPRVRVNPYILRPGTFKALKEHLAQVKSGFYHIVHFDLHGAVMEYEELASERKQGSLRFMHHYSFGKPIQAFQVRYGREDIQPFEGKQAFLFFETDKKGLAEPASAKEVAALMRDSRIPVCILNACQSAKQEGASSETSLAKFLQEQGIDMVLAMRYSVSVTAAAMLMERLYSELFNEKPIGEAISLGRRELFNDKNRDAALGYQVELEDWVLPVIYQRQEVEFKLRELTEEENNARYRLRSRLARFPNFRHGFIGRDLDILKVEKMLLPQQNHLLLRGMVGVGKSALLQYLAAWWVATNFKNIQNAFYLDFGNAGYSHEELLTFIAQKIYDEAAFTHWQSKGLDYRKEALLDELNTTPYALILDNIFEFSDEAIINFLSRINGASFVVYGSVNGEEKLMKHTFQDAVYQLDGLDKESAYQLAGKIIKATTGKGIQTLVEDNKFEFEHLLKLLAGFPVAMELVLPFLKSMSVEEVLEGFRNGTLDTLIF